MGVISKAEVAMDNVMRSDPIKNLLSAVFISSSTVMPPLVEIFSDRIVITSSGGLPQDLTVDEFFSGISAPRNKELMRIFKDLKLAESKLAPA